MTESAAPPKAPKLFDALRTDPKKVAEGAWIEHPDTGDRMRVRRWLCAEHARAYLQAVADYKAKHGDASIETPEAERHIEAVSMSTGLITDWAIKNDPRPYDAAVMASALVDPELRDLRLWIKAQAQEREAFRPDDALGN